jgi:3-oxoacyl-[acyl-carrier protein] reductase
MHRGAIISGGTRGLGLAISTRLARAGFTPALLYHQDHEAARMAVDGLRDSASGAFALACDISDPEVVKAAIEKVSSELGSIEVLVNNAFRSTGVPKKVHELDPEAWSAGITTNLSGAFLLTRAVLPSMLAASYGRIVFVGSLAARGEPGRSIYAAAKNGLVGLMRTLAKEYAQHGITSNMVSPGFMDAGAFLRLDEEVRERAAKSVPMKRLGKAEEIAEAVLYFASIEAGYTTGQILGVDGGA